MLQLLSNRYQKHIAWGMYLLFLSLLGGEARATLRMGEWGYYTNNHRRPDSLHLGANKGKDEVKPKVDNTKVPPVQLNKENRLTTSAPLALKANGGQLALQGPGPGQPEMQSFKSVGADNMVDLFTGDFSYNIPLLDVGGYPVGLHYNSGVTMDQEASWVGLGWNINPGTIGRNVRGLPDDFNGEDQVSKTQYIKPNKTVGGSIGVEKEIFAKKPDFLKSVLDTVGLSLNFKLGMFYNNYKGWGVQYSVSPTLSAGLTNRGSLTAGLSLGNNSQTGLDVSPSVGVTLMGKGEKALGLNTHVTTNYNSRTGISELQMGVSPAFNNTLTKELAQSFSSLYPSAAISFVKPSFSPTISMPYTNYSYAFSLKLGKFSGNKMKLKGVTLEGYTSMNIIAVADMTQTLPAYGYLYYSKAKDKGDRVLLDFNRDKEVPYRSNTPHIGVPSYTYDVYSISGEGIGGSFRPYRGDIGFVFDHYNATRSGSGNLAIDLGAGSFAQLGADLRTIRNNNYTGAWPYESNLLRRGISFKEQDSTYEPVYFKNPGEKVKVDGTFYQNLGDTDLVRLNVTGISSNNSSDPILTRALDRYRNQVFVGKTLLTANTYKKERDKRTQVISYLDAATASKFALDTLIKAYQINEIPTMGCNTNVYTLPRQGGIRKGHHLSEITVLNTEGKRYVYGLPVYNKMQKEVSFAVKNTLANAATGMVKYTPGYENSVNNQTDKTDHFYSAESTPAYAHSFLLSGILSADYVDITGNGISDDDQGDAVKFNYSRIYGEGLGYYRWRAPFAKDSAAYSEGLKSDVRDDRGSYTYGEKEIWYLNSVESKTMIACFKLETDSVRQDVYGTINENGGRDNNQKLYRLKEINLYTKADLVKYGPSNAKPIKTVHFGYDYSLCKNHPGSSAPGVGKLTLRRVWFTYNKNYKGERNPYRFTYSNTNPDYNNKSYDRWGNYKPASLNIGTANNKLTNQDFPYSTQDSIAAANNASAWSLTEIRLPSGAKMKVTYESDDYGYVQNRRATQMMEVVGFGANGSANPSGFLYNRNPLGAPIGSSISNVVFVKVPEVANTKAEVFQKYLEGISKVMLRFNMQVPGDTWGSGSEMVPCSFEVDDYGVKGNPADRIIWIKPKDVDGKNAFLLAGTQFLKMNLYSKAFKYSEPGDDITVKAFLGALTSVFGNFKNALLGYYNYQLSLGNSQVVAPEYSFIKLNNPGYRKLGGGHRIKKVEIFDNWNKMTGQQESVYGQEYDYTDSIVVNGVARSVSSGVAAYEPMIGKEENAFTVPMDPYKEQVGILAPTDYFYTDEPVMESFYPSAMVGYSKVRVHSINKDKQSANGYAQTEFYTTKDFPTLSSYTPLVEGESRYTYNKPKPNKFSFYRFNAKSFVTLTQGFKVELNDMNGKVKATASFAENDLKNPLSFTRNYYRLENDRLENRLSNTVDVMDSATGVITKGAEMGKEVEVMVDLRQQLSTTVNSNLSLNLLIKKANGTPYPIPIPIVFPFRQTETNRYRSAAVTKVVNRYGILDSVVVIDKGSRVTTKNLVYDSETGDVVLTQTNNEFNDPIYNFSYPAHWAYSGMGPAYRNIQTKLIYQQITDGVLADRSKEKYFESGDEVMLTEMEQVTKNGIAIPDKFVTKQRKIWAIDAEKGSEAHRGIYFIDANGQPVSTEKNDLSSLYILRSGKRNMAGAGVGAVTAMANPVKWVNNQWQMVLDSNSRIINASAARYKDFWRVDSTISPTDSCYKVVRQGYIELRPTRSLSLEDFAANRQEIRTSKMNGQHASVGYKRQFAGGNRSITAYSSTILDFDFSRLPLSAMVTNATLSLDSKAYKDNFAGSAGVTTNTYAHYNEGTSQDRFNNGFNIQRVLTNWGAGTRSNAIVYAQEKQYVAPVATGCNDLVDQNCTALIDSCVRYRDDTYGLIFNNAGNSAAANSNSRHHVRTFYTGFGYTCNSSDLCNGQSACRVPDTPVLKIWYNYLKDTCVAVCKPSIRPEGFNPYKYGVLGNWRADRAYTYYGERKQRMVAIETDIRKDGEIQSYMPYWQFASTLTAAAADTNRWVWNSEMVAFNRKGFDIENRDPLNRYNSAQYGYNRTLPIAVAQNSKNRNMVFDGFEDYDYKTGYCEPTCSPSPCLPTVYDSVLNNCDTLQNVLNRFVSGIYVAPNPPIVTDSNGCDTTSWYFPQCPVTPPLGNVTGAYSFSSMFYSGIVGYPDSAQVSRSVVKLSNQNFGIGYKRPICLGTNAATYKANFKTILLPAITPQSCFFIVPIIDNGTVRQMYVNIGHNTVGSLLCSGLSAIPRPDLSYNFTGNYHTLQLVYRADDTIEVRVNNTLLGNVGPMITGATLQRPLQMPVLQFDRVAAKVDWIQYLDGNGNIALDENFNNGCSGFALPKPAYDCTVRPECSTAFTNYFNQRFGTSFSYQQIGTLYANCNILVGPCGDTMPKCTGAGAAPMPLGSILDRFNNFTNNVGQRTMEQRHTGRYSLKVAAGKTAGNVVPLVTAAEDALEPGMSIRIDSTLNKGVYTSTPKGTGLLTRYGVFRAKKGSFWNHSINGCMNANIEEWAPWWNPNTSIGNIDVNWDWGGPQQYDPQQYCAIDHFGAEWTGRLQVPRTEKYVFSLDISVGDAGTLYINSQAVPFKLNNGIYQTDSISLTACTLHNFRFFFREYQKDAHVRLLWASTSMRARRVIDSKYYYPPSVSTADTIGSCHPVQVVAKMQGVKPRNLMNPLFSPIAGTQVVVGAWVKESQPCYNGGYANSSIEVSFGGSTQVYTLRPKGNIIEGWQRIEEVIAIPATATSMNIALRATGSVDAYFDDIRVHPFNANLKSFVYNPFNLRLMAELDENNYASFYEYDDDGTLIRVKKETVSGIKTVQETRSTLGRE